VLLLLDYWPLGRWPLADPRRSPGAPRRSPAILSLVAEKIPLLALAALSSAVTYVAQQRGGAMDLLPRLPLADRLANAAVSYVRYLGKMLWPFDLAALYPYPAAGWPPWQIAAATLLVAGLTAVTVWQSRQRPYLAAGWFLYLGMLVPVIGIVQVGYQALADRYTYLPLIGIFVAGAWGLDDLAPGLRVRRRVLFAAVAAALALLAARTWSQALVWRDEAALFEQARRVTSGNFVAAYNLGNARMKERNIPEATRLYREALRLKPDYPEAHNNLGAALALEGRREEALVHYREAVRLVPRFAEAHTGLGTLLLGEGRLDEAAGHYRQVLQVKPGDPVALFGLGTIYARQGRDAEAEVSFRSLLLLRPDDAAAHVNLGNVLSRQGRAEEGTRHYLEALRIDPGNADAHYNLGVTLAVQGRFAEAAARFREALRLKPDFAEARADLEKVSAQPRR
jgi:Flp pilus assembly protein TadD